MPFQRAKIAMTKPIPIEPFESAQISRWCSRTVLLQELYDSVHAHNLRDRLQSNGKGTRIAVEQAPSMSLRNR